MFYKNYPNRKDWRSQYRDSRRFDSSCQCHRGCPWCKNNRLHFDKKKRHFFDLELKEYKRNYDYIY